MDGYSGSVVLSRWVSSLRATDLPITEANYRAGAAGHNRRHVMLYHTGEE